MEQFKEITEQRELLESMELPFAVFGRTGGKILTLVLSKGFCALFGYKNSEEAYRDKGRDLFSKTHPDDVMRVSDAAEKFASEGGEYNVIYRYKKDADGPYRIMHASGKYADTEGGEELAYVWYTDEGEYREASGSDINSLAVSLGSALHEESIIKANNYDYLTGLPGMSYFFELSGAARDRIVKAGDEPVMLFFNFCGMRFYNGKNGFSKGDKMLKAFAVLISEYFGKKNCGRFGQDHFVVVTKEDGLEDMLKWLFEEWAAKYDGALPVRVGIYKNSTAVVDAGTACDRAKLACDKLKNAQKSAYEYFDEEMLEETKNRRYIIENLDKAIKEKRIKVYYQPIVRAVNGRVCDEEALARWTDPEKGILPPSKFIPYLEEAGLIYKLDLYVVDQVLEKLKAQKEAGRGTVPQSVNLSRTDFDSCDMVEEIRKRVDRAGVSRDMLTIEITESVIGKDYDFMKRQIDRFQRLGFRVWMDDFGNGYSSLDVLQSIGFQLIKFDMRFMQQFNEGDGGRIILAELMKMATALGVDTVCEGVETAEQIRFLREIGCSKLQGYYFGKPVPLDDPSLNGLKEQIIKYEDPKQSEYFESIGRINLHDLAVLTEGDEKGFSNYFDTLPMAIIEVNGDSVRFVRSNKSYRRFISSRYGIDISNEKSDYKDTPYGPGSTFMELMKECCRAGSRAFFDETLPDGSSVHSFARRIGVNPETGDVAVAVAVLSITDPGAGISYANIARTLAADYFNLFYVDLETEDFIEYSSGVGEEKLALERHGVDFFNASRRDAASVLHPDDVAGFVVAFTKEKLLKELDEQGTFTLTYRQNINGTYVYVNMKAMRMLQDERYLIIGVSNIDSHMKQKELLDRINSEKTAYSRLMALSGNCLCLYTVDPLTGKYFEYEAESDYKGLGFAKEGEDFFRQGVVDGKKTVYAGDLPLYLSGFTKEKVLESINKNGYFELCYRLNIGGKPIPVTLKAVMVKEGDSDILIVGVIRNKKGKT